MVRKATESIWNSYKTTGNLNRSYTTTKNKISNSWMHPKCIQNLTTEPYFLKGFWQKCKKYQIKLISSPSTYIFTQNHSNFINKSYQQRLTIAKNNQLSWNGMIFSFWIWQIFIKHSFVKIEKPHCLPSAISSWSSYSLGSLAEISTTLDFSMGFSSIHGANLSSWKISEIYFLFSLDLFSRI